MRIRNFICFVFFVVISCTIEEIDYDKKTEVELASIQDTLWTLLKNDVLPFDSAHAYFVNKLRNYAFDYSYRNNPFHKYSMWAEFAERVFASDSIAWEKKVLVLGWESVPYMTVEEIFPRIEAEQRPKAWDLLWKFDRKVDDWRMYDDQRDVIFYLDIWLAKFLEASFDSEYDLNWYIIRSVNFDGSKFSDGFYVKVIEEWPRKHGHYGGFWKRVTAARILFSRGYFQSDDSLQTLIYGYYPVNPVWDRLLDSLRHKGWTFEQRTGFKYSMVQGLAFSGGKLPLEFYLAVVEYPSSYLFGPRVKIAALNELYGLGYEPTDQWLIDRLNKFWSPWATWIKAVAQFRDPEWVEQFRHEGWEFKR